MKLSFAAVAVTLTLFSAASFALTPGTYHASYPGINGKVPVSVSFSKDKILSITVDGSKETPGIGQTAASTLPKKIVEAQSLGVDGVSGASITSKAIFDGVADCIRQAGGDPAAFRKKAVAKPHAKAQSAVQKVNTDLVIVGGGAAGMIAAINGADHGLKVTLLEKMPFLGGSSAICGGSVIVTGSKLQRDLGEKTDTPAKLAYDLLYNGHQKNDLNALTFYADNVGKSIDWIMSKGVQFTDKFSFRAEFQVPRMVPLKGGCPRYAQTLRDLVAKEKNVRVMLNTRASEIIMKNGHAVGIRAKTTDGTPVVVNGRAVLLATGGFGNNKSMLAGDLKNALYYGPVSSTGDGHQMAEKIGADLQLMDYGKVYPQGIQVAPGLAKSTLQGNIGAYDEAGILVNSKGLRVVNEKGSGIQMMDVMLKEPSKTLYLALDPKSYEGFHRLIGRNGVSQQELDQWFAANGTKEPIFIHAKSLEEACRIAGIDAANLRQTIKKYNSHVKSRNDPEFHRQPKFMKKTIDDSGDFYIIEQKPRFATTLGGVKVTTSMEVLNKKGDVIPGLYAAGEVANSVHGDDSTPGGNLSFGITTGKTVSDVIAAKLGKK